MVCTVATDIHGEVVHARPASLICEAVPAVAVVVDAVPRFKYVEFSVEREPKLATLDRNVFPRPRRVRVEDPGINSGPDRRAHQLELDAGEHGREDVPFPSGRITDDRLLGRAQQHHARRAFLSEQPGHARVEARGDPVEHGDRGHFRTSFDRRKHAGTHTGARRERLKGLAAPDAFLADPTRERRQIESGCGSARRFALHYSAVYYTIVVGEAK